MSHLLFALLFFLATTVQAAAIGATETENTTTTTHSTTPSDAVLGGLAIVFGFLFCFFGTAMWRFTLFAAGFLVFANIAVLALNGIEANTSTGSFGPNRLWIRLAVQVLLGLLGGYIAQRLYKLGVCLVGAVGGFYLAMWLLSLSPFGFINTDYGRVLFVVAFVVVCAPLALKAEKHVVVIATAVGGSYVFVSGVDSFVHSGFNEWAYLALGGPQTPVSGTFFKDQNYAQSGTAYALIAIVPVMALLGMVVQYKRYKPRGK